MTKPGFYALDIGGSKVECARVSGGEVRSQRLRLPDRSDFDEDGRVLRDFLAPLMDRPIGGVVVGFPGLIDNRTIVKWPNRPAWEEHDLLELLDVCFPGADVHLDDDANLGALSSRPLFPTASDWIYVNAGSGIGCGIVLDGRLFRGERGFAGELGHTVVAPEAAQRCACGKRGCLQLYASGRAIAERLAQASLGEDRGGAWAGEVVEEAAGFLAVAVANLVCLLDVSHVHLGGGLSHEPQFAATFERVLRESEQRFLGRELTIECGIFDNATLVGALVEVASEGSRADQADREAVRLFIDEARRHAISKRKDD